MSETPVRNAPGSTIVLDRDTATDTRSQDPGDHDRFAHYALKDQITESMVTGIPIRALCGKKWVPSRIPEKYPLCPDCKEAWESVPPGK